MRIILVFSSQDLEKSNYILHLSMYLIYIYVVLYKIYQTKHLHKYYIQTLKVNIMNMFKTLIQILFSTGSLGIYKWLVLVVSANNKNWMYPFPLSLM